MAAQFFQYKDERGIQTIKINIQAMVLRPNGGGWGKASYAQQAPSPPTSVNVSGDGGTAQRSAGSG
eukprot:11225566-Lingulodinium_polyedra.AAC.1